MKFKQQRVKNLIKREILDLIVKQEVHDPRVPTFLTITYITLSKDLRYAHIYFSLIGSEEQKKDAEAGLNSATGFMQKKMGKRLELKYTPILEFRYDYNDDQASNVDKILDNLHDETE